MGFTSLPHHLWIFSTAFGEAVLKTQRFCAHGLPRTQQAVRPASPRRSVIREHAATTALRTQRLDSGPLGTAIGGSAVPKTPPDFARLCRTVRFSIRPATRPYGFPYGRAKPCSDRFCDSGLVSQLQESFHEGVLFPQDGFLPGRDLAVTILGRQEEEAQESPGSGPASPAHTDWHGSWRADRRNPRPATASPPDMTPVSTGRSEARGRYPISRSAPAPVHKRGRQWKGLCGRSARPAEAFCRLS